MDVMIGGNLVAPPRRIAPLWLMGLTNSVFGMYGGILVIAVPQLLSIRQVPETTIAAMTAVMISPGFWTFLVSPVLDVRFGRRWYSAASAAMAAALLVAALLNLDHLALVEGLLVAGYFFANLYQSALGGWLASITTAAQENKLSSWVTIGNLGGGGAMAVAAGELTRNLSPGSAAIVLGGAIVLPTLVFPFMPAPGPDRRLAGESFSQFFGDVLRLVKRREVLIAVVLFIAPAATFSLTNFLGGIGDDFHASTHFVSLVGGGGVLLGGIAGCLLFRLIDRLLPLRFLYLAIGLVGSLFTLVLVLLPRTPAVFAVAFIGENVFQALAITTSTAITFETIGRRNPIAATVFCLLVSAYNIPITYMLFVDGWGYGKQAVAGSFVADAALGVVACVLLGILLIWVTRRHSSASAAPSAPMALGSDV
jgi:PAT family beta-lactamase induction signal transducer AmpG